MNTHENVDASDESLLIDEKVNDACRFAAVADFYAARVDVTKTVTSVAKTFTVQELCLMSQSV